MTGKCVGVGDVLNAEGWTICPPLSSFGSSLVSSLPVSSNSSPLRRGWNLARDVNNDDVNVTLVVGILGAPPPPNCPLGRVDPPMGGLAGIAGTLMGGRRKLTRYQSLAVLAWRLAGRLKASWEGCEGFSQSPARRQARAFARVCESVRIPSLLSHRVEICLCNRHLVSETFPCSRHKPSHEVSHGAENPPRCSIKGMRIGHALAARYLEEASDG